MTVFVSPHNDDEVLFGAFTLLRERPLVLVAYDSYVQANRGLKVTAEQRRAETEAACEVLGVIPRFLGWRDDDLAINPLRLGAEIERLAPDEVYGPAFEVKGHPQHNFVAGALNGLRGVKRYLTYTAEGKSTSQNEVPICQGDWIGKKLKALSCYTSQFDLDPRMGCYPHFLRDQREYYA